VPAVLDKAAALLAIVVLALALGACGDDDSGGGDDPEARAELIAALSPEAFEGIESGVLDIGLEGEVEGDDAGSFTGTLTGPFDANGQVQLDAGFEVDSEEGDFEFEGVLVATTDNLYAGPTGNVYELGSERFNALKALSEQSSAGTTPSDLTQGFTASCRAQVKTAGGDPAVCDEVDPADWLASASDEGTEDVGGVETQQYEGEVDFGALFDDIIKVGRESVPPGQARALDLFGQFEEGRDEIEEVFKSTTIEVNRGVDDGITRRVAFNLEADADGEAFDFTFDIALHDLNGPQTITAPEGAQPIESLRSQIPFFVQPIFDCFLNARTAADINRCSMSLGGFGTGTGVASS
jgi:hypothetical protein